MVRKSIARSSNIIRLILFIFGIIGITGFIIPILTRRIFNLGNIAGLLVCLFIITYSIFMPKIHNIIFAFWQKTIGKIILTIFGAGIFAVVISVVIMSIFMIQAAASEPAENSTVIILGCKVYGESPSLMLMERMDAAIKYLNANPESVCIVSGGKGDDEGISEAECMYRYLSANGISPDRIYKEDKSTSTRENIAFSYEIIKSYGLSENIAIATNDFHEYRAGKIADKLGLTEHGAVSGKTAIWLLPTYYVRELYGIMYEWLLQ